MKNMYCNQKSLKRYQKYPIPSSKPENPKNKKKASTRTEP
jgi:hypothetical protein